MQTSKEGGYSYSEALDGLNILVRTTFIADHGRVFVSIADAGDIAVARAFQHRSLITGAVHFVGNDVAGARTEVSGRKSFSAQVAESARTINDQMSLSAMWARYRNWR